MAMIRCVISITMHCGEKEFTAEPSEGARIRNMGPRSRSLYDEHVTPVEAEEQ